MFSSVCFGEWTKVEESVKRDSFYVDFDSIKQENGYIYYWMMRDYLKPVRGDLSIKFYQQGDCNLFRFKGLNWIFYKEPMGQGDSKIYTSPDENWTYPHPNSSWEIVLLTVCKFAKNK